MKLVYLLCGMCAMLNALVSCSKPSPPQKNACDPSPCKHDALCRVDTRNQSVFTCVCPPSDLYTGRLCELKTGCFKNPCKSNGTCANDPKDKTKHICSCSEGLIGNCDTSKVDLLWFDLSDSINKQLDFIYYLFWKTNK